ncbi:MAG: hypothetical protein U0136_06015 [Bdellovibrionota bacterium]
MEPAPKLCETVWETGCRWPKGQLQSVSQPLHYSEVGDEISEKTLINLNAFGAVSLATMVVTETVPELLPSVWVNEQPHGKEGDMDVMSKL